jgi:P-type E1-E2 ATPase
MRARVGGADVRVGSRAWLESEGVDVSPLGDALAQADAAGETALLVARGDEALGVLRARDRLRAEAREVVAALRERGLEVALLSGDREGPVRAAARGAGIERHEAGLTPIEKAAWLAQRRAEGWGMVGDGVNDAPALAEAAVGFAVGGATDVAIGAAPVALVGEGLARVPEAIDLARRTLRTIRQNLLWAFGFNALGIPAAAAGALDPMWAAGAMAGSSLFVVGNALRLRRLLAVPEAGR